MAAQEEACIDRARRRLIRDNQDEGTAWLGRAIGWFFDVFELVWKLRNDVQFGNTDEMKAVVRSNEADRTMRRLCVESQQLPMHERHPFQASRASVLESELSDKERWVLLTTKHVKAARKRAAKNGEDGQRSVTECFDRVAAAADTNLQDDPDPDP